ncbi:MAG TPA: 4-(cytidine 5'-diphospho)-2-C-methyl-D-erythritol kinase [Steroidobacteraceae bacterium]|nr:4-(cytidine 5'-diphospho)-2-C-methyl-D-erythritol kinase [Steroidobacteraceae bacterium]
MGVSGDPWPAPAKLNLFLHVLGRRADGYHELQTAFQIIDLCDEIGFDPRNDGQVTRVEGPFEVPPFDDLVVQAARRLQKEQRTSRPLGVSIHLRKRIPLNSGLGGGSSDAATTLVALNVLWGLGLSVERLADIGLDLGADVPVFVRGHSAWAEGIGERLTPTELPEMAYIVIYPGVGVSTREVFQAPELTRNSDPITIRAFLESEVGNDCEPVVRALYPQVAAALDWLSGYAPAQLTGTGSCVFAPVHDFKRAERLVSEVPFGWQGFLVQGRNRSPLLERLERAGSAASGRTRL